MVEHTALRRRPDVFLFINMAATSSNRPSGKNSLFGINAYHSPRSAGVAVATFPALSLLLHTLTAYRGVQSLPAQPSHINCNDRRAGLAVTPLLGMLPFSDTVKLFGGRFN